MDRICHRCHEELPAELASGTYGGDDDRPLFCPRCGAPQILLPHYMRTDVSAARTLEGATTGAVPPPRPQMVDWPVALTSAIPIAAAVALFSVLSTATAGAFFLATLCVLSGSSIVLGIYRARRPLAQVNGPVGLRIGWLTGLLMVSLTLTGLAATGVFVRYGLHGMAGFDDLMQKQQAQQQMASDQMLEQTFGTRLDPAQKQWQMQLLASPEYRAGSLLAGVFLQGFLVIVLTSALGGFAGLLQSRRRALRRGD